MRKYGITCIGVKDNYHLYYDDKHNEYLLMTPNFRFTRMFGHCNNSEISKWAYKIRENHRVKINETIRTK